MNMIPAGEDPTKDDPQQQQPNKGRSVIGLDAKRRSLHSPSIRSFNPNKLNGHRPPAPRLASLVGPDGRAALPQLRGPRRNFIMSRIFNALTAEPWAIIPSELQKIAAVASAIPRCRGSRQGRRTRPTSSATIS
jgi:hypothetical protein